jgi:hypothetical protein
MNSKICGILLLPFLLQAGTPEARPTYGLMADRGASCPRELLPLANILLEIQAASPWREFNAAPATWKVEDGEALARQLAPLEEHFNRLSALLSDPVWREAAEESGFCGIPSLAESRNATNLLCGRAILDVREGQPERGLLRLGEAVVVSGLINDYSEIGRACRQVTDQIIVMALATIHEQQAR